MSSILRKNYKSPEDLKKVDSSIYFKILKKALAQVSKEIPKTEESEDGISADNTRFFYVLDFEFRDSSAPLLWIGAMTPA